MKIHEYQAKEIFRSGGIPITRSIVAETPEEAEKAAIKIGKPVAIKSQVLVGGRGKAGGIKFAEDPKMAYQLTKELLGTQIRGETVKKVLVEEMLEIQDEFYMSVAVDRSARKPLIMVSMAGGVDIEEVASKTPEKIVKYYLDPLDQFLPYQAREIAHKMGVNNSLISQVGGIIWKLYQIFHSFDANIVEINPLVLTRDGLIAADAKLDIDDDSLYRHQDLAQLRTEPRDEFAYVKLDGNIAVIGNGAGLTLTGMDMLKLYGGKPATFLDIGGGASQENIARALNLVISNPQVKVVFLNVLGGITRADDVANGVITVLKESEREVPLVIRLTGTNEEEGQRILTAAGVSYETSMEDAARKAVEICNSL
ncbi:ADP-forming succinate--CoA ligase subunit beta [Methanobacterium ferruginis]|uniref:ADP-forming succinate--CoA ligase subunit beta n=1 Tax=Methanobacterium ferruginis TaxID=710191 RepID=UPI0025730A63|nr:ADP-forming succinate--CoA ligase subunit beta [Methanobacterium ferruginis]BDZ67591.1 succinate--CoA ligase subunit beta [Methanobacterium ferruginis]